MSTRKLPVVIAAGLVSAMFVFAAAPAVRAQEAPSADLLAQGEKVYQKCVRCHSLAAGGEQVDGPNLHGFLGRKIGSAPGYMYSDAMKAKGGEMWTTATLDAYLANPKEYLPGGIMNFMGLRKPEDRAAVIAYMQVATK